MIEKKGHKIDISLSTDVYKDKEVCNAAIGVITGTSDLARKNRETLKEHGLPANRGMCFTKENMMVHEILNKMIQGYSMAHIHTYNEKGILTKGEKTYDNFREAWFIGIDIDNSSISMRKYIEKLPFKPSFFYTTYSNEQPGKGYRFRLGFILNVPIKNIYQFRYVGMLLCEMLERATGEEIKDKCTLSVSQYMNGTYSLNPHLINFDYGMSFNVFELSDFGYSNVGFLQFLKMNCMYKSNDHVEPIKKLLYLMTGKHFNYIRGQFLEVMMGNEDTVKQKEDDYNTSNELSDECEKILGLWDTMEDFKKCADWNKIITNPDFKLIYRLEKGVGNYRFEPVDKDFFCFPYINPNDKLYDENGEKKGVFGGRAKYRDGDCRRKKIYHRTCLRRLMKKGLTSEDLVYQTIKDILMFFDNSDRVLNSKFIKRTVSKAMSMNDAEIRCLFEDEINLLKKYGQTKYKRIIKHSVKECLMKFYDFNKTIKENEEYINGVLGLEISRRSFYNFFKIFESTSPLKGDSASSSKCVLHKSGHFDGKIEEEQTDLLTKNSKIMSKKEIKKQVVEEIYNEDNTLSVRNIQALCEEKGVKISISRVGEILKELKKAGTQKAGTQKAGTQKAGTNENETVEEKTIGIDGFITVEYPKSYKELPTNEEDWVEKILNSVSKEELDECKKSETINKL